MKIVTAACARLGRAVRDLRATYTAAAIRRGVRRALRAAGPSRHGGRAVLVAMLALWVAQGAVAVQRLGDPATPAGAPLLAPAEVAEVDVVQPAPSPSPSVSASAAPSPKPAARPKPKKPDVEMFGGLGAWIDVYDGELDPVASVRRMRRAHVRTLYIQTGRWNMRHAVDPYVGPWLRAAHREGIKVVGWYLPGYGDVRRDVKRTVAIARYRYRGHRFDGLGIDIEWRQNVRRRAVWNGRVARQARNVRNALGRSYPIAAITPSPLQMRVAPGYWAGFPWRDLAKVSDVVMTMSYWSYRQDCPQRPVHCAYEYTKTDVALARKLTGGRVPIHIVGGVGDAVSAREVRDFVRGAKRARPFGASFYDFGVTRSAYWRHLSRLRTL